MDPPEKTCEESKNIDDKNQELLKAIKCKTDIKSKIDLFDECLNPEAIVLIKEIKDIGDNVDYDKLFFFTGGNKETLEFKEF